MCWIPGSLHVWDWLPALSLLNSKLIRCKSLQQHCLSCRTLNISSLCSGFSSAADQVRGKHDVFPVRKMNYSQCAFLHFPFGNITEPQVLRRHTQLETFYSLLCCQVGPCDYVLVNGTWAEVACVSTDAPVTFLKDYLCTTFTSLIFLWWFSWFFFSAHTAIFLKLFLLLIWFSVDPTLLLY